MKGKFLSILLIVGLFLFFSNPLIYANEMNGMINADNNQQGYYLKEGIKIEAIYRVTENGLMELTFEEYDKLINFNKTIYNPSFHKSTQYTHITPQSYLGLEDYTIYHEIGYQLAVVRNDLRKRISIVVANFTTQNSQMTIKFETSQGYTISLA